jgi:hypothetical protein
MELRVWSVVVVEHDCGAAVESLLENGDSRLKLEASGQEDMDRCTGAAAYERDRPDESISAYIMARRHP